MAKAIGKPALHAPLMTAYLLSSFEGLPKLAVPLATGEYLKLGQTQYTFFNDCNVVTIAIIACTLHSSRIRPMLLTTKDLGVLGMPPVT